MNKEINKIKDQIKSLKDTIDESYQSLEAFYNKGLLEIFQANPSLVSISLRVNNHEFNDGDATSFSVYTDCPTLTLKDVNGDEEEDVEEGPIFDKLVEFFQLFEYEAFYEKLYGDAYEYINISLNEKGEVEAG